MSFLELLKYIFIGAVQGITEILPISSSGHVEFLTEVFKIEADTGYFFSSLLNLGSFIAIFIFFLKFEKQLLHDFFLYVFKKDRSKDVVLSFKYVIALIIATIPVGIVGYFFSERISEFYNGSIMIVLGISFLACATLLYFTKDIVNKYTTQKMSYSDGLIIGLLQPIALLPGLSRLALTTCTGLIRKKSMGTSLRFSILLYLPISFGQLVLGASKVFNNSDELFNLDVTLVYYLSAVAASVFVTFFALKKIFIWVRKGSFGIFAIYNLIIGLIAFIYGLSVN